MCPMRLPLWFLLYLCGADQNLRQTGRVSGFLLVTAERAAIQILTTSQQVIRKELSRFIYDAVFAI